MSARSTSGSLGALSSPERVVSPSNNRIPEFVSKVREDASNRAGRAGVLGHPALSLLGSVRIERVRLIIPEPALVVLVGPSGAGKSTFAGMHFKLTEIISSDSLRAMLSDDPSDQDASAEAFRVLAILANGRLKRRLTTVIDATNLRAANRRRFIQLASRYGIPAIAVAFDLPPEQYLAHNRRRPDRVVDDDVVADQASRMRDAMASLPTEGYSALSVISDPRELSSTTVERIRPPLP
jgi:protein phosphatase